MIKSFFKILSSIYITNLFYYVGSTLVLLLIISHFIPSLNILANYLLLIYAVLIFANVIILFAKNKAVIAQRKVAERLSNGDDNKVKINLENRLPFTIYMTVIDEIPAQFQYRDFRIQLSLKAKHKTTEYYYLRPTERGEYTFGSLNVFIQTKFSFISRRIQFDSNKEVAVYPSYMQLRKFELLAISNRLTEAGIKKIRRVSHNVEFEQIRDYVQGDDIRTVNWKATARRYQLMVNQYQDEKSQHVYSLIDMGRTMEMPFNGLSLLDYAINASLVISNIAMFKQDKAGLITFSKDIHNVVSANRNKFQMHRILETLYRQTTLFAESDFEKVYSTIKRNIKQRSLLLLFTNFEWKVSLNRQIRFLRQLNKHHLLIVIVFKNTEIDNFIRNKAKSVKNVYEKTIAEKLVVEKEFIVKELSKYGIQSILTKPENLTVDTINKYLEMKARTI